MERVGCQCSEGMGWKLGTCDYCSPDWHPHPYGTTGKEKQSPATHCLQELGRSAKLARQASTISRKLYLFFKCNTVRPRVKRKPETVPERSQEANTKSWDKFHLVLHQNLHVILFPFFSSFCLFTFSGCLLVFIVCFIFLFRFSISYHTIIIWNPIHHPSLVLNHFTIFLNFITVVVNLIFSHTRLCSYRLLSLILLHLTSHRCSSFLSQLTFFFPTYKSLISSPPFIYSG